MELMEGEGKTMPENVKVITTEALIGKFRQALSEKWGYIARDGKSTFDF